MVKYAVNFCRDSSYSPDGQGQAPVCIGARVLPEPLCAFSKSLGVKVLVIFDLQTRHAQCKVMNRLLMLDQ